jgi:predicted RNase H-like HicB family nuclease
MTGYAVIIERAGDNFSAYVPDLPGVISTGDTVEETQRNIAEAIALYLEEARATGEPIPPPTTVVQYVTPTTPAA